MAECGCGGECNVTYKDKYSILGRYRGLDGHIRACVNRLVIMCVLSEV